MSRTVDEKVVSMKFDNKNFEDNVQTTMSTIDKLKRSLNFDGASKSFDNINTAANKVDLTGISSGVSSLENRFSTLGIVGMRVIQNLTDSAMRLAYKLGNFLVSGIVQGGINRATNLEKAHFQLQGLLKDEEKVQAVMKNVNDSVDQTAYSLDQAAIVASQFAATGMEAGDKMYGALRAVAGIAATASADYSRVGQIFTKVAGQGRLMGDDLLSLSSLGINAAATLAKQLGKTEAEVRDMVSKGKISFQMFAEAMDKAFGDHAKKANETFTGSMANVKAALARIGAEFVSPLIVQNGVLVKLLNTIRERVNDVKAEVGPFADLFVNTITKIATKATEFLEIFEVTNYIKAFYNVVLSIVNVFKGLWTVIKPIGQAFRDIFPPVASSTLLKYSEKLVELTSKFKLSDKAAEKLRATFRGLFSVGEGIVNILKAITKGITSLFDKGIDIPDILLSITSSFEKIGTCFSDFISKFLNKIKEGGPSLSKILETLSTMLKNVGKNLSDFLNNNKVAEGGVLVLLIYWIRRLVILLRNFTREIKSFGGLDVTRSMLAQLTDTLYQMENKVRYEAILKIASALAVLAVSLLLLSSIDQGDLAKGLVAITTMTVILTKAMKSFIAQIQIFSKDEGMFKRLFYISAEMEVVRNMSNTLIKFAAAILILSFAVKNLASVDLPGLIKGLIGVGVLFAELAAFLKAMDKINSKEFATKLIPMAVGLLILTQSVKQLAALSLEELTIGLFGVGILITEIYMLMEGMNSDDKKITKFAGQMLIMSFAIGILANVAKLLSSFSWVELIKAGAGLLGIVAMLVGAAKIMNDKYSEITKFAGQMLIMSFAIGILANVAKLLSSFSWVELIKAGAGLLGIVAMLVGAAKIMNDKYSEITKFAGQMLIMSFAIGILANVAKLLSSFSWVELIKAGAGLLGIVAMLVGVSKILKAMESNAGAAASILIISAAMVVFAGAMKILGEMPLWNIIKALGAMTLALLIFGGAAAGLEAVIPAMLGIAGAIALIGIGCLTVGTGILALAAGLTMLAHMTTAAATAIVKSISVIIVGLIELIPSIIGALTDAVVAICQVFIQSLPTIGEAVKAFILTIVDVIVECVPAIVEGALFLLSSLLQSLAEHLPEIVQAGFDIILALLGGIRDNIGEIVNVAGDIIINFLDAMGTKIPEITQAGIDFIFNLIEGMAQGVEENAERAREVMLELAESMLNAVLEFFGIHSPSTVFADVGGNLIQGLINGIDSLDSNAIDTIKTLASNLVSKISSKSSEFTEKGRLFMSNLKNGITSKISDIKSAVGKVVSGALDKLKEKISSFKSIGSNMIEGLKEGIKSAASSVVEAAKGVCSSAIEGAKNLLKINSPSKVFIKIGKGIPEGLAVGIDKLGGMVRSSVASMADIAINETKSAMSTVADYVGGNIETQPTIRPVVDLSGVSSVYGNINFGANVDTSFMGGPIDSISQIMRDTKDAINASNIEVINAVNGLRDDMNDLYSSDDAEIGLYVDGRKLASSIAKPMNYQLNLIAKRGG